MAESYFQYAEHYFRILNAMNQAAQQNDRQGQQGGSTQPYRRQEYQSEQPESGSAEESNGMNGEAAVEPRPIPIAAGLPE